MRFSREIDSYIDRLIKTINSLNKREIDQVLQLLEQAYLEEKHVFIMGNGGSASTASHFAADFNKGVSSGKSRCFKVISLCDNTATLTAYANDIGYDYIFIEPIKNLVKPGDLVIGISGSGNSKNILNAIKHARGIGAKTIGFTGYNGGKLKEISQYSVNVNIDDMQITEDIHMILNHLMMRILYHYLD